MMMNNGYNQYKENSVYTATPEELTLMLYNGLVKFIMQAQSAIEENLVERANGSIIRAQDIIREFQVTLDMKYEVSKNLYNIYEYMISRLIQSNIKKDKDILQEVLGMAKDLRDTWAQAMKIAKRHVSSNDEIAK